MGAFQFDNVSPKIVFLNRRKNGNDKGKADDPIKYFAAPENQDLGIVKALRKTVSSLDLSAFPAPS